MNAHKPLARFCEGRSCGIAATLVLLAVFVAPASVAASTTDVYVAQTGGGAGSGADCADAYPLTFFNDPSQWGSGASAIGPGTTVHLCGAFNAPAGANNYLATQGSGAMGAPITIVFESGATLSSPYWGGPAILVQNDFITVNGGANGVIEATDNGTNKGNQQPGGIGVQLTGASNVVVENLTISNLYVRTGMSDDNDYDGAISASGGSNIQWKNNTVHDMHWALVYSSAGGSTSNIEIGPGNDIYDTDHGAVIAIGNGTTATVTGAVVDGNHIHDFANWDATSDDFHHDGVHVFDFANDSMSQVYVYNNLIDGNWGMNDNAGVYIEGADEGGTITSCGILNNVFNPSGGANANGAYADYSTTGCLQANNTIFADGMESEFQMSMGSTIYNNVGISQSRLILGGDGGKIFASDYNDFYPAPAAGSNSFIAPGGVCCVDTLANWTKQTGLDAHSLTVNPNLTSAYVPMLGSPVIAAGKNLSSLCQGQSSPGLGALCADAAGVARPATGNWDMGAYQACAGSDCNPMAPDGGSSQDAGGPSGDAGSSIEGGSKDASVPDASSSSKATATRGSGGCSCLVGEASAGQGSLACVGAVLLALARRRGRKDDRRGARSPRGGSRCHTGSSRFPR